MTRTRFKALLNRYIAHYKLWLLILVSLLLTALLYQKTESPLLEQRASILKQTFMLNELQRAILDSLDTPQNQTINHFDTLNYQSVALQSHLMTLIKNPAIHTNNVLDKSLQTLLILSQEQSELVNQFKTNYLVLHNSWAYFPSTFDQCFTVLHAQSHQELEPLLIKTFMSGVTLKQALNDASLQSFNDHLNQLKLATQDVQCKPFMQHSDLISRYTPVLQKTHQTLFSLPIGSEIAQFYSLLEQAISALDQRNKHIYLLISLF
ncbi:DAHL domain-containing protein [Thiomicrorhabdus aquaedulcis]|uniref:DAHL domain-containing protein n=1 Tax=Thiomicrorhabdus aquaedulcis TaxID=2211106 RepID=UPI000FD9A394|nr:DAHL domain-containing protein [Thiomicrorhabdus aquaedulcis]